MFHDTGFMGMWWLWLIVIFLFVIVLFFIVNMSRKNIQTETSTEILKKRYAKGEINKEEFEQMKRDLSN